ncbi:MAG: hypothetical protein IPN89_18465 [Saprospiraceae bacterium]|nr:hypothetical protein [Saprospiraceae bacterium]
MPQYDVKGIHDGYISVPQLLCIKIKIFTPSRSSTEVSSLGIIKGAQELSSTTMTDTCEKTEIVKKTAKKREMDNLILAFILLVLILLK